MEVFRHIRYARAGRFEDPVPAGFSEGFTGGRKPAACPQMPFRLGFLMGEREECELSEDCHFLSIWTPSREGRYPVLVWIHGGAYVAGSSEEAAYDGAALRWVKKYIAGFGGDPDRITLAGQSAGGHSVAAIMSSCSSAHGSGGARST